MESASRKTFRDKGDFGHSEKRDEAISQRQIENRNNLLKFVFD